MKFFVKKHELATFITELDSLKLKSLIKESKKKNIDVDFHEIDANKIVFVLIVSNTHEYAPYTFLFKILMLLLNFFN